jgi:Protein of unknown function (DUF3179)
MKRALACVLGLGALASLAWVAVPIVLIRPFGPQTTRGIALSYALRSRAAAITTVLLVLGAAAVVALWPRLVTWLGRSLAAAALLVLGFAAFLGRANHFEWMFSPLPHPEFDAVAAADHMTGTDVVLAVESGGQARGYPVRALAHHHVVNDVIAGEPIVATY